MVAGWPGFEVLSIDSGACWEYRRRGRSYYCTENDSLFMGTHVCLYSSSTLLSIHLHLTHQNASASKPCSHYITLFV